MAFTFDSVIEKITELQPQNGGEIEPCTQTDARLLQLQTGLAEATKRLQTVSALVAAEIAHRSRRELGQNGLAYRAGFRTPEKLIQQVTGTTGADARKLVRVGTHVAETLAGDSLEGGFRKGEGDGRSLDLPPLGDGAGNEMADNVDSDGDATGTLRGEPWHAELDRAVADGRISVDAADGVRRGLGEPGEGASENALRKAATRLIEYASRANADDVWARARNERDLLDPDGIAVRERQRRDARYLRLTRLPDGMTRLNGLLDPESAQIVCSAFDAVTSPRRGGPRFVSNSDRQRAQKLLDDPRSIEQIMADTLVDIVTLAVRKDDGRVFGAVRPTVRLVANVDAAERGEGPQGSAFGVLLGQTDPVSVESVERHLCSGHNEVVLDTDGHTMHYGRSKRTFSAHQREVLNARDGGCMWPYCDRPPDWCEAHHIDEWLRDSGKTDVDDGILLCRSCHLRLHNGGWRIHRRSDGQGGRDQYWLRPPGRDDARGDIPLHRKHPLLDALHHVG
jgi:hypothetical protein